MLDRFRMREGWLTFALLFLILLNVSLSMQAAEWAAGLLILQPVVVVAFLLGVLFAKSRVTGFLLHPVALLVGLFWLGYLSLRLVAPGPWGDQLAEVIVRLLLWGQAVITGGTSGDTLPFVLLLAAYTWLLAYGVAWDFYRARHIWIGLLLSGATLLVNTYYARPDLTPLFISFVILSFLLVIRVNLLEHERRWRRERISFSSEMQLDVMRDGALFAVAIVAFAWFTPGLIEVSDSNPLLTRISQPWGRAQQEWSRLFTSLNYQGTPTGTWFSRSMNFRGPLNRSDRLVMTVKSEKGRYWRAVVLDRYTSAGWVVTDERLMDGPGPDEPLAGVPLDESRATVAQEFTIFSPAGPLLFAAAQPLQVNLPTQLLFGGPTSQLGTPPADTISQLFSRESLFQGQNYSVVSAISEADVATLRAAGDSYPDYIQEHYLQVPETLPQRVRDLAAELTGGAATNYDKAKILETYLRAIPYSESISGPRPGEDGVDYFLFREGQGYCDYYASALAVMLRSIGVPSRLAQGYSQGTFLPSGVYEVRQLNAHTWVEVFFPDVGWVEFEPTAAEEAIFRPTGELGTAEDDALPVPDGSDNLADQATKDALDEQQAALAEQNAGRREGALLVIDPLVILALLAVMGAVVVTSGTGWLLAQRRWRGLGKVARLFDQVGLVGRIVGARRDPTLTPAEYAERLGEQVPPAASPLRRLAGLFSQERFAPRPLEPDEVQEAQNSWLEARRALWRGLLERFNRSPPRK